MKAIFAGVTAFDHCRTRSRLVIEHRNQLTCVCKLYCIHADLEHADSLRLCEWDTSVETKAC